MVDSGRCRPGLGPRNNYAKEQLDLICILIRSLELQALKWLGEAKRERHELVSIFIDRSRSNVPPLPRDGPCWCVCMCVVTFAQVGCKAVDGFKRDL